jgi:hypothetical protein
MTCARRAASLAVTLAALLAATGCTNKQDDSPVISAPTQTATQSPTPVPTTRAPTPTPDEQRPKPGLESAPPLGRPVCRGQALTVTDADTLVDPSYRKEVFVVRTTGADCQLKGYPTVQVQGVTVQHGGYGLPAEEPQPVTLSRSTSLSFVISSARAGSCRDVPTIVVTLPGTSVGHRTATSLRVCGSAVGVSPVHRQGEVD